MSKDLRKTVELATKPKRAAPKAKYIDPIVQSTFNQDGALQEIIRTLALRVRDPNTTVAFKSLITLHTVMRSGALEPVYSYLATSSVALALASHEAPNIAAYGRYLGARIKSYSNLKRDVIRDKSDRRAKDRLRKLKVEQGLLRETREIQRMIAACVESKFYTDDVDDDVSMTALRLLTKDLLILFTCVNEGMINILEHYFEMSHTDATTALKIYKTFCKDTERVVAYLGIAKKLYNVLNVPIPNLKHAPVSLAGSLEEYLNDPNFEKNRSEYKENKRVADGGQPSSTSKPPTPSATPAPSTSAAASSSAAAPSATEQGQQAPAKSFTDFFESIEQSQTSMFPGSPSMNGTLSSQMTGFGTMAGGPANPFGMMGGNAFGQFPQQQLPMMTGFNPQPQSPNPFLQPQFTGFAPVQQPQFTGFAPPPQMQQPQMTGMAANPFRQSMMPTAGGGGGPFGNGAGGMMQPQMTGNPFSQPQQQQQQPFLQSQTTGFNAFGSGGAGGGMRPMSMMQPQMTGQNPFMNAGQHQPPSRQNTLSPSYTNPSLPTIPQSSPSPFATTSTQPSSSPAPNTSAPLVAQKTGARNPFAPAGTLIPQTVPEEPRGPSMNELAFSSFQQQQQQPPPGMNGAVTGGTQSGTETRSEQKKPQDAFSKFLEAQKTGTLPLTSQKTGGLFASIASDFTFDRGQQLQSPQPPPPVGSSSLTSPFSSMSLSSTSQAPPASSYLSSQPTGNPSYLSSQQTGTTSSFAASARKPFQPTSSFGSTLFNEFSASGSSPSSSLPPPVPTTVTNGSTSSPQPLQPQSTGYNPFAGSKLPPLNSTLNGTSAFGGAGYNGGGAGGGPTTGSLI
ncbi:hypothetical protein JCM11491_001846 [Sporobolomyces phaffii]